MRKIIKIEKDGCRPCEMNAKMMAEHQALLDEFGIHVETVNITKNPERIEEFDLAGVPVTIFQNLPYENRVNGFMTSAHFSEQVSRMLRGYQ